MVMQYLHSSITGGLVSRLWGMRVAPSHAIAQGTFHAGSFCNGCDDLGSLGNALDGFHRGRRQLRSQQGYVAR